MKDILQNVICVILSSCYFQRKGAIYLRFQDAYTDAELFKFNYYSRTNMKNVTREEDNLKIYYNKKYYKLEDYILLRNKYN